jgi:non-lysosomal glucosylceramidase
MKICDMKKNVIIALLLCLGASTANAKVWQPQPWPVLKTYDSQHLYRIALPLGGIGTGTVSLGGRGELRDWEIMNVPAKNYSTVTTGNNAPFFAIYVQPQQGDATTTLLSGPLYPQEYMHYEGRPVNHHGLPRFSDVSFSAAYPFGQVHLDDKSLPVKVTVKGFNPLIPGDADASGLPVAVLSYEVTNKTSQPIKVSVCGSLRNFIGKDGSKFTTDWKGDYIPLGAKKNKNIFRQDNGLEGIYFSTDGVDSKSPAWGTMALTTEESQGVSYRTSSKSDDWSNAMLNFWDDFSADGTLTERAPSGEDDPMASLAVKKTVPANASTTFTFYLTWDFPNRYAWSSKVVGNYYSTQCADAWDAAKKIVPQMTSLEQRTLNFVNAFLQSSYPEPVKEAALFNLSALRSQTAFRIADGHLMGWEGVMDRFGSCYGSCTHVWNYEVATPFLFGALAKTMRDVEFNYATKENGLMNFRAALPLSEAAKGNSAAADGQMGCVMKFYRDWQLCGDKDFLQSNWQQVKKVLSYAWVQRGWDGNQDGVMEGAQHNTMDVSYFGPNPQMGFWYMGALRAAEEMAKAMHDKAFEKKCRQLFLKGSAWMDANLFNGEYYEQKITDPHTFEYLDMNNPKVKLPDYQLGRGCLVDQLVGQYMAHICGLGYLGDKKNMKTTLQSVMKYNSLPDFSRHFNNMRSYIMGNEAGLLMASWPKGRLEVPFPYFAESMTGFEYCAAAGMLYEGMDQEGLTCIKAIRDRFDGAKRNPFDEPECGHHYARSMASWSAVLALSGFHYSAVDQTMSITSNPGKYFWSNGYAWGTIEVTPSTLTLNVLSGTLKLKKLTVGSARTIRLKGNVLTAPCHQIYQL